MNMTSLTCKFLQSLLRHLARSAEGFFFFPPPVPPSALISALRNTIDQEIRHNHLPPLRFLTDPTLLKFYPVCLISFSVRRLQGLQASVLHHLPHQTSSLWLCFTASFYVILCAHNYQPSCGLETLWKFPHPLFSPNTLLLSLPLWAKKERGVNKR